MGIILVVVPALLALSGMNPFTAVGVVVVGLALTLGLAWVVDRLSRDDAS
jgi:type IV secretory pathway VirB2 component (pilin)